jgi:hypothetical protein
MGRELAIALIWLAACGGGDPQRSELVDDGEVCLRLQASGTLQVDVVFHHCLNSCDIAQPVSCNVSKEETDGGPVVVRVASRGAVETTGASVCSPDCGKLRAACTSTDTFAPGKHSVVHGEDTAEILLGAHQQCLFRE